MAGKALIFSAPSGSGKTTIVRHLLSQNPDLSFSISATTRKKRSDSEQEGTDYYFLSPEEFKDKIDAHEFIEWQEVYSGYFYGTLKSEVERIWAQQKNVIFDVDVTGGINLKKYFGKNALAIFVKVPSIEILTQRLLSRGTETAENLSKRLAKASFEWSLEDKFDVTLWNENLAQSLQKAQSLYNHFTKT